MANHARFLLPRCIKRRKPTSAIVLQIAANELTKGKRRRFHSQIASESVKILRLTEESAGIADQRRNAPAKCCDISRVQLSAKNALQPPLAGKIIFEAKFAAKLRRSIYLRLGRLMHTHTTTCIVF